MMAMLKMGCAATDLLAAVSGDGMVWGVLKGLAVL
jgi:hypothetical protein